MFLLVDGNNFLHRAYHSVLKNNFTNSRGFPTGATKVYVNMIISLEKNYKDAQIAFVFDAKGKSFRHELYNDYKATRKPMDEDLRKQVGIIKDIIRAMGYLIIEVPNVEADDVIGTYATMADKNNQKLKIVSGDKDLSYFVNENITILDTMKKREFHEQDIIEKFGVPPKLISDYLALVGDTSDNVPGMDGVGEKTAAILLNEIGDIDEIAKRLDEVEYLKFRGSKNFAEKFNLLREQIYLSRELTKIKVDVEVPYTLDQIVRGNIDHAELLNIYKFCEFKDLVRKEQEICDQLGLEVQNSMKESNVTENICGTEEASEIITVSRPIVNVSHIEQLGELKSYIEKECSVDFLIYDNGTNNSCLERRAILYAFGLRNIIYVIKPEDENLLNQNLLSAKNVIQSLKDIFESKDIKKVTIDAKNVLSILKNESCDFCNYDDVLVINNLVRGNRSLSLDGLLEELYDYKCLKLKLDKSGDSYLCTEEELNRDIEQKLNLVKTIYESFKKELVTNKKLNRLYEKEELPLIEVLCKMERNGIALNTLKLTELKNELCKQIDVLVNQIYECSGEKFNINSPKQLSEILFEKNNLPSPKKKTQSGGYSTSEDVLSELADKGYELPKLILDYRTLNKLLTTYVEKLPTYINEKTGRIHPNYNQTGILTGRLSCNDPNIQNIPVRTENGKEIRKAFIARKGYKIVAADYSQIELRVMSFIANERSMIEAFNRGDDIHKTTAALVNNIPLESVTSSQRRAAKAINFGLIYGMSAFGLAKQLGIENKEAKQFIENYFLTYPNIRKYMEDTKNSVNVNLYVETLSGRKIYFRELSSAKGMLKQALERAAINAPIQGSAAEIIKNAMCRIHEWIKELDDKICLLLQIHDELVFEVREDFVEQAKEKIKELMTEKLGSEVLLDVEIGVGDNWNEAH
jgi:DNA polymerase-1